MTSDKTFSPEVGQAETRRLFLREPGWKLGHKTGSEKEFCYMQSPGQDYYHRLLDGEIYAYNGDERLCLSCAGRRGLLTSEAKALRTADGFIEVVEPGDGDTFDVRGDVDE
jgi:hypothetical protein